MNQLSFYIITSDATSEILPTTAYLFNKYWNPIGGQHFKILGNHQINKKLPENFEFVKVKNENNINKWTRYLYDYISDNETSDYFLLTLDDYWPNGFLKPEILNNLITYARSHKKIGRIALGRLDVEKWEQIQDFGNFKIVKLLKKSPYRLSCQISLWHKDYFLKYFQNTWTPWELELLGSKLAQHDDWEVIGVDGDWPFSWVEESALSGRWPGMINILGLRLEDVKYLIEQKMLDSKKLQYGIWYDTKIPFVSKFQSISKKLTYIPKFSKIGYNFNWKMIKPYIRSKTYKRLYYRYKNIYK